MRLIAVSLLLVFLLPFARAFKPISGTADDTRIIAIQGYDPVAYFTEGEAVRGSPLLAVEWQGAFWYFRKQSHRDKFLSNPVKYAPRYGGYCALCVAESEGISTDGNPEYFVIHDGGLYLLQNEELLKKWRRDPGKYTAKADRVYESLLAMHGEE